MFLSGLWSWGEMVCLLFFFPNKLHQSIYHVSSSLHSRLLFFSFSSPPPLSSESQEQNSLKHLWQVHVNVQAWLKKEEEEKKKKNFLEWGQEEKQERLSKYRRKKYMTESLEFMNF